MTAVAAVVGQGLVNVTEDVNVRRNAHAVIVHAAERENTGSVHVKEIVIMMTVTEKVSAGNVKGVIVIENESMPRLDLAAAVIEGLLLNLKPVSR